MRSGQGNSAFGISGRYVVVEEGAGAICRLWICFIL